MGMQKRGSQACISPLTTPPPCFTPSLHLQCRHQLHLVVRHDPFLPSCTPPPPASHPVYTCSAATSCTRLSGIALSRAMYG